MIPAGVLAERRWIRVRGCFDSLDEVGFINAVNLIVLCLYACNRVDFMIKDLSDIYANFVSIST